MSQSWAEVQNLRWLGHIDNEQSRLPGHTLEALCSVEYLHQPTIRCRKWRASIRLPIEDLANVLAVPLIWDANSDTFGVANPACVQWMRLLNIFFLLEWRITVLLFEVG